MSSTTWAAQNSTDRANGEAWEVRFTVMVAALGMECHKPQPPEVWWPDRKTLPDRVVVGPHGKEWHELKHKNPTRRGEYGLEEYRLEADLRLARHTGEAVLYTIHDWQLAGASRGGDDIANRLEDWLTVDMTSLDGAHSRVAEHERTYYGSETATTRVYYWATSFWTPLAWRWGLRVPAKAVPPHTCSWWRAPEDEWVEGAGLVPVFTCTVCGERFAWTARIAAEYLAAKRSASA